MSQWKQVPFLEAFADDSAGDKRLQQSEYQEAGRFPVVDQGEKAIAGFTDDETYLSRSKLPVVVFGDHTRRFKFVDHPFVVGADGVKILAPRPEVDAKYGFHYLRSISLPEAGYSRHFKFLREVAIPLPPLPEQRRIADILDRADNLRAQRRRGIALLGQLEESIFARIFGDLTQNPAGYQVARFAELGELERGVSRARPRNSPHLLGGNYPLVQTGEVAGSGGYVRTYSQTYSDEGLAQSRMWPAGTLAITIAANIAKTGILTFEACFPDSVVGFTPDRSKADVEYIRFWLRSLQVTLERQAPASAQKNINLAILRALMVPVPPIASQKQFARNIASIQRLKSEHFEHLTKLDELFASLQQRAFQGEL